MHSCRNLTHAESSSRGRRNLQSPIPKSTIENPIARVAKLADAPDLGSGGEILRGSSPLPGTSKEQTSDIDRSEITGRSGSDVWMLDARARAISVGVSALWFATNASRREMHSHSVLFQYLSAAYRNDGRFRRPARCNRQ